VCVMLVALKEGGVGGGRENLSGDSGPMSPNYSAPGVRDLLNVLHPWRARRGLPALKASRKLRDSAQPMTLCGQVDRICVQVEQRVGRASSPPR
jgi:hypothetical protein